jgi:hypothetical protein
MYKTAHSVGYRGGASSPGRGVSSDRSITIDLITICPAASISHLAATLPPRALAVAALPSVSATPPLQLWQRTAGRARYTSTVRCTLKEPDGLC